MLLNNFKGLFSDKPGLTYALHHGIDTGDKPPVSRPYRYDRDGVEFAVGNIKKLFKKATQNTRVKHEKWAKYHTKRKRDVNIRVNDWMPVGSATKKVVAKFKPKFEATRGLLATDHVILNHGQVTWTTPELAPPLLTTTPHQREDVSALDRFNVHRCPTRRVFSGTGLEPVTKQATVRYLYHSATAATANGRSKVKGMENPVLISLDKVDTSDSKIVRSLMIVQQVAEPNPLKSILEISSKYAKLDDFLISASSSSCASASSSNARELDEQGQAHPGAHKRRIW
ncbi:uncharacterized protein TNCV_1394771 [Trichonephila clavipes]|nr:uncharacterized protein TNCV_1394771 [Trichonephila clavipes]